MYISPIETPKCNNLDIRVSYEGYSLQKKKKIYMIRNVMHSPVSSFANQLFKYGHKIHVRMVSLINIIMNI